MLRPGLAAAAVALAAVAAYRSDAFWCGARGLPLGTWLRPAGFSYEEMPSLAGRTVLVTGANTGLGLEVATQCARAGATVILACRDAAKADAAVRTILEATGAPAPAVRAVRLDLADLQQVEQAADELLGLDALDVVVNNAGVATQFPQPALTVDDIERTFQANFLGHFHLVRRLLPLLERTAARSGRPSRIVHLSSGAHRAAPAEGAPLTLEGINDVSIGAFSRYGIAKLASIAWSNELARRYRPTILSNAVHPGVVASEMLREENFRAMLGPALGPLAWRLAKLRNLLLAYSLRTAALGVLYCAASEEVGQRGTSGEFFVPVATRWAPRHPKATDPAFGAALWKASEELVDGALSAARRSPAAAGARPAAGK
mmetsp:Transcript_65785/g.175215  ORF Transcript_65785/g.175215 Transcript_65785/m.175215 type:complete len:374 (-) Transcript_65785:30-1151(-)